MLPDIPYSTEPQTSSDNAADPLNNTRRQSNVSPHRRPSAMPEELDSLGDTLRSNVSVSKVQRQTSIRTDQTDELSSTIGSQRRGSTKLSNIGDDLNSTVGSMGSKRRGSLRPAAAAQAEKTAKEMAALDAVINGEIQQILPPQKSSIVRVFLSSTFSGKGIMYVST